MLPTQRSPTTPTQSIDDPTRLDGVRGIGVDEKRFLNATAEHRTVFTTQIVDLDRHRLLDVVEGRSRDVLGRWLADRGPDWCDRITLATLDPAAGYRAALVEHLPNATLVVDHFHAIKLANAAIDDIRRRVQQRQLGHRGRKGDPLYRARRVFLTGIDRLTDERIGRASNGRVENVHMLAEKIRRNAHGFANHHNYRPPAAQPSRKIASECPGERRKWRFDRSNARSLRTGRQA